MLKKSLSLLLLFALIFCGVQLYSRSYLLTHPFVTQLVTFIYIWIPGLVAFVYAKRENIPLPIFSKPKKWLFLTPVYCLAICGIAFLLGIPFGLAKNPSPLFANQSALGIMGYAILIFAVCIVILGPLFSFVFLGGELYWRGYLWEKLKGLGPLKALTLIALCWSLWQMPLTLFTLAPGFSRIFSLIMLVLFNFALSPILTYFRLKGGSILHAAFFHTIFLLSFVYFVILFPLYELKKIGIYCSLILGVLIVFSLLFRLYSSKTWKELT